MSDGRRQGHTVQIWILWICLKKYLDRLLGSISGAIKGSERSSVSSNAKIKVVCLPCSGAGVGVGGYSHQDGRKLGFAWHQNVHMTKFANTCMDKILWMEWDCWSGVRDSTLDTKARSRSQKLTGFLGNKGMRMLDCYPLWNWKDLNRPF